MFMRSIKQIIKSEKVNMGGIVLDQPLPNKFIDNMDPFLLIHHWDEDLKGGKKQKDVGVGPHPHRGFSPVTLIFNGSVHHRDSRGNNSVVNEGGTQWMFAGKGITHSERPAKELAENGGTLEFIQFWVNVPSKNKMEQPYYKAIPREEKSIYKSENRKVEVAVVSGEFNSVKGEVDTHTPINTLRFNFIEDGEIEFEISKEQNTLFYLLKGKLIVNDEQEINTKDLVHFSNDDSKLKFNAKENSYGILLSGLPIGEEVASYGPFVMNTQTEIMEAMRDSQMGKMGVLIEEF
ncbi:MAG: pirin family protein [Ignavibacteria bacterium]|nr:pirin family protein [Ignavibacteria bacterium]MBT8382425.1 pirin family protein [Ignavibacteria bacterium]MBT8390181.1 pirin family protein [Ignavibacteria bacterium]NNJ52778.1 pirin family protein [Ignavibacteriaceae bacterium]NNL20360.1 pirin family protein [Ignavibacteriaceae bacterium]